MIGTVGEIRMISFDRAPSGWFFCDGSEHPMGDQLGQLLGNFYGGDGINTYKVPDLRGMLPIGAGINKVLSGPVALGQNLGQQQLLLSPEQVMAHTHNTGNAQINISGTMIASSESGDISSPASSYLIYNPGNGMYSNAVFPAMQSQPLNVAYNQTVNTGSMREPNGQPHDNDQPYLCVNFIICASGDYPITQ